MFKFYYLEYLSAIFFKVVLRLEHLSAIFFKVLVLCGLGENHKLEIQFRAILMKI